MAFSLVSSTRSPCLVTDLSMTASGGVNITKIGRFENHYVFLSKPMVDDRALQSDERDARVIMPRWDFATFMQMQPNGRACAQ